VYRRASKDHHAGLHSVHCGTVRRHWLAQRRWGHHCTVQRYRHRLPAAFLDGHMGPAAEPRHRAGARQLAELGRQHGRMHPVQQQPGMPRAAASWSARPVCSGTVLSSQLFGRALEGQRPVGQYWINTHHDVDNVHTHLWWQQQLHPCAI